MNIKILDSWLKDYVKTSATPKKIAELLSLSSVSVERLEKYKNDYVYDIEVTTNRPDLMSLVGLARETATVLTQNGIKATFTPPVILNSFQDLNKEIPKQVRNDKTHITIKNNPKLVNRICAVVMEVTVKPSPKEIQERLEATDIRSLNNLIDVTNYVMRVIGHPTHVFDYDRLNTKSLTIREAKAGETIQTLDKKTYKLLGGDIVAENDKGEIVDLLGIMGLENSVVTDQTKRILFFIDNNNPLHMRRTSMTHGIRSEAVILNEKDLDPELAMDAMYYGIELFKEIADGKLASDIVDIYPNKLEKRSVSVTEEHISSVIGVPVSIKQAAHIMEQLGFETKIKASTLTVVPPSFRAKDIAIPQDIIEEIARIYGYANIPDKLPPFEEARPYAYSHNEFFWEDHVKDMLKYWGFTEVYTYPMVSENLYDGSLTDAVTIANPLTEDFVYMRRTLTPSLIKVVEDNKKYDRVHIFELANVYHKKHNDLPIQTLRLAGAIRKPKVSFFEAKGFLEQLFSDLEIQHISYQATKHGAQIFLQKEVLGTITVENKHMVTFELNFEMLLEHATLQKFYTPPSKYPPVVEDLALLAPGHITIEDIVTLIKKQSTLIVDVSLLDKYQETRTFHIVYQSYQKNLTAEDVTPIREKIVKVLHEKLGARLKK